MSVKFVEKISGNSLRNEAPEVHAIRGSPCSRYPSRSGESHRTYSPMIVPIALTILYRPDRARINASLLVISGRAGVHGASGRIT